MLTSWLDGSWLPVSFRFVQVSFVVCRLAVARVELLLRVAAWFEMCLQSPGSRTSFFRREARSAKQPSCSATTWFGLTIELPSRVA